MTGGKTSNHTNVMYVQLENCGPHCDERFKDTKTLSSTLKEIATGMEVHGHFKTRKISIQ